MRGSRRVGTGTGRRGAGVGLGGSAAASGAMYIANTEVLLVGSRGIDDATAGVAVPRWRDQAGNDDDAVQATGTNQPIFETSGGRHVSFDGVDNYLSIADSARISPTAAFSILFWVFQDATATRYVSQKGGSGSVDLQHIIESNVNKLKAFVGPSNASWGQTPAASFPSATWLACAVVYDGAQGTDATRLVIDINGAAQSLTFSATPIPATVADSTGALLVGALATTSGFWNGDMAEYRFVSRAITSAERAAWYAFGRPQ